MLYYELNINYIIETYCVNKDKPQLQCNGKCFLAKQLTLESKKENTSSHHTLKIVEAFYPLYYHKPKTLAISSHVEISKKPDFPRSQGKTIAHQDIIDPPPRVC